MLDSRRQALAADVRGIAVAGWVNTVPRLERGDPWHEMSVDGPDQRAVGAVPSPPVADTVRRGAPVHP